MRLAAIVAMSRNGVIGRDNQLPWRLADDMQHFRSVTMGKPIIMGRKTFESIGQPLPGRRNIVVSRQLPEREKECKITRSLGEAVAHARGLCEEQELDEGLVIGGAQLYNAAMPQLERLYLTLVDEQITGDAWFPFIDWQAWHCLELANYPRNERNDCSFTTLQLDRKPAD